MQRGYDEEFTGLRSARSSDLRRTAYLLAGDSHRAEDLVQVALTKREVALPSVHGRRSVEGLLQVDELQVTRGAVTGVVPVRQGGRVRRTQDAACFSPVDEGNLGEC